MSNLSILWDPGYWRKTFEGTSKLIEGDIIYEMIIGEGDDDYCGSYEITTLISKENYENIIKYNYFIEKFPNNMVNLLLFNENLELIPLVKGNKIDFNKLSIYQKEYIEYLKNSNIFVDKYTARSNLKTRKK